MRASRSVSLEDQLLGYSTKEYEVEWASNAKKTGMQKEMLDRWQEADIDVVITLAGPHTAVLPGDWTMDTYTVAWNVMDYPAVIIPFTRSMQRRA